MLPLCFRNTPRSKQNGPHFIDDFFKYIFLNENVRNLIGISLKFIQGTIHSIPALVQIMAWHWPGNEPLSEPESMMVRLPMQICVTQPQWVKVGKVGAVIAKTSLQRKELSVAFRGILTQIRNHVSVNSSPPSASYISQGIGPGLVQVMACHLLGAKPLP